MTGTGLLAVERGKPFTIELPATPTAGYQWQAAGLPAGVTLDRTEFRSPAGAPARAAAGGTSLQVLHFTATEPGMHRIDLVYQRPWEPEPAGHRSVNIHVR
jgi:predicted secreted protein